MFGIAGAVLVALLAGGGWYYRSVRAGGQAIDSVAVLPFVNASGDPNSEYLSDGITESLINSLSQLPHLRVMSRDSAFMFKGKDTDARTVGSQVGVRAVFKGRVMQRGDNLEISAELVDARDDSHIWGDQYSRKAADIFALQGDLAKEMTMALRMRLSGEDERRMTKSYTASPEAYQGYLQGRYWWSKRTEEGFNKGVQYFQQAIEKDPRYALAFSGLADCYSLAADYGLVPPKEAFPKAKEAALKALQLDDTLAEAHTSVGIINAYYDWDWSGAEREYRRAIALNPSYAETHNFYGSLLMSTGQFEEAIAEYKRALGPDPFSLPSNAFLGNAFYAARQYDQAIEQERKTLELEPNFGLAHFVLGQAYLQKSMYQEGIAEFQKVSENTITESGRITALGYAYALAGRKGEAQRVLEQLNALSKQKYVPARWEAVIYAGLGEKEKALEWLQKAYEDRSIGTFFISIKADHCCPN